MAVADSQPHIIPRGVSNKEDKPGCNQICFPEQSLNTKIYQNVEYHGAYKSAYLNGISDILDAI